MVPAGNALGVLSRKLHINLKKILNPDIKYQIINKKTNEKWIYRLKLAVS